MTEVVLKKLENKKGTQATVHRHPYPSQPETLLPSIGSQPHTGVLWSLAVP